MNLQEQFAIKQLQEEEQSNYGQSQSFLQDVSFLDVQNGKKRKKKKIDKGSLDQYIKNKDWKLEIKSGIDLIKPKSQNVKLLHLRLKSETNLLQTSDCLYSNLKIKKLPQFKKEVNQTQLQKDFQYKDYLSGALQSYLEKRKLIIIKKLNNQTQEVFFKYPNKTENGSKNILKKQLLIETKPKPRQVTYKEIVKSVQNKIMNENNQPYFGTQYYKSNKSEVVKQQNTRSILLNKKILNLMHQKTKMKQKDDNLNLKLFTRPVPVKTVIKSKSQKNYDQQITSKND